jgi:hypothetical protein
VKGKIQEEDRESSEMPDRIQFDAVNIDSLSVKAQIDSLGNYDLQLPVGICKASMPGKLITKSDVVFKVEGQDTLIEV